MKKFYHKKQQKQKSEKQLFGDGVLCPRCGSSPVICPCHFVPGRHGTVQALGDDDYKQWKREHRKEKESQHGTRRGHGTGTGRGLAAKGTRR